MTGPPTAQPSRPPQGRDTALRARHDTGSTDRLRRSTPSAGGRPARARPAAQGGGDADADHHRSERDDGAGAGHPREPRRGHGPGPAARREEARARPRAALPRRGRRAPEPGTRPATICGPRKSSPSTGSSTSCGSQCSRRNQRTALATVWSATRKCSPIALNETPAACIAAASAAIRWYTGATPRKSTSSGISAKVRRLCVRFAGWCESRMSSVRSTGLRDRARRVSPLRCRRGCASAGRRRPRRRGPRAPGGRCRRRGAGRCRASREAVGAGANRASGAPGGGRVLVEQEVVEALDVVQGRFEPADGHVSPVRRSASAASSSSHTVTASCGTAWPVST